MSELFEKLNRIVLLIKCLFASLIIGKANKKSNQHPSVVIVILTGKLGDVVCCTPVLRMIRTYLPNTRIIAQKTTRPILSDSGLVDEYIDFEEKMGAVERIKKYKADAAFVTGPSFIPTALLYLSGIPLVVAPKVEGGFCPFETKPYKILQQLIAVFPYRMGEYAPRERLRALEAIGIVSSDTKKHLGYSKKAEEKVMKFLENSNVNIKHDFIVGISPSAGNKIKNWGGKKFAQLADYIYQKHSAKIIIIGSEIDKYEVKEMINTLNPDTKVINAFNMFDIDELKAIISKMNILIAVDTGSIYIAEAFNVATIDIVGPVDDREQPPVGEKHKIVKIENRIPEVHILNARLYNKIEARRQIDEISVDMVIEKFNELLRNMIV